jgi:cytochrome bd-type quinol oxidase subunit 1
MVSVIEQEKSSKAVIVMTMGMMSLIALAVLSISSPMHKLLGESQYALRAAFHGLFAGMFMVTMTMGLYQAFRLWVGASMNIREMEIGSVINTAACFLTIVFGNWLYIPYRAAEGPRAYFLEKSPEIHGIFFEFKEFTALFTLPLLVAVTYIICRYQQRLNYNKHLREMAALLLVLAFFYFIGAFGLGAVITKLKAV